MEAKGTRILPFASTTTDSASAAANGFLGPFSSAKVAPTVEGVAPMPDRAKADGQSTVPIIVVAESRAVVRLNRPREHNRLEPIDLAVLHETFARVDADPSVRVLVLTGTGQSF